MQTIKASDLKKLMTRSTNSRIFLKSDETRVDKPNQHKILLKSKQICYINPTLKLPENASVLNLTKEDTRGSQLLPLPKIICRQRRSKSERLRQRKSYSVKISKSFNESPQLEVKANSVNSIETKKSNTKVEIIKPYATKVSSISEKTLSTSSSTNETTFNHIDEKTKLKEDDTDDELIVSFSFLLLSNSYFAGLQI